MRALREREMEGGRVNESDKWISFSSDYSLIALFGDCVFLLLFHIKFIEFVLILMLSNYIRFDVVGCCYFFFARSLAFLVRN